MATIIEKERVPAISEILKELEQVEPTSEIHPSGSSKCAVFDISRRNTVNNTIQVLKMKTDLRFKTRVEMFTEKVKRMVNGQEVEVDQEVEKVCVWRIA